MHFDAVISILRTNIFWQEMTGLLSYIFLLAGMQGVLLFVLLFTKKQNHGANIILAVSILVLSLDLFLSAAFISKWYYSFPHLLGINYAFPFLYGPLFYLYVRALTAVDEQPDKKHLLHFIPYLTVVLYMLPDFMLNGPDKLVFIENLMKQQPLGYSIFDHLKPVHGIIYTVLTIVEVKKHNLRIRESFSNVDKINLVWFRNLVTGMVLIWSIVAISVILDDILNTSIVANEGVIYFAISILVYSIGYMGLNQPDIFKQCHELCMNADKDNVPESRYRKSGLSEKTASEISGRLMELMEKEKPYLDTELTLRSLSEKLDVSQHNLSEVINTKLETNFFDLINKYRVEEFKKKLENPESFNYNLLAIAMDSGFNSKTSFNVIFKKFTQMTPSQYRARLKAMVIQ